MEILTPPSFSLKSRQGGGQNLGTVLTYLCREIGDFFPWSNFDQHCLVDQTYENFGWSEKAGQKTSFFGGGFTGNRFVSMIRCSKHFGGTCFHPNSLMSSYLVNWRKIFFLKFWHFSIFWPFLHIFSLLKIAVNNSFAIFTNVLHLKNIWILSNNQEYILFVNLQHMLIFGQHLLNFSQHLLTWNYIHATKMYITYLIYSETMYIFVVWI